MGQGHAPGAHSRRDQSPATGRLQLQRDRELYGRLLLSSVAVWNSCQASRAPKFTVSINVSASPGCQLLLDMVQ